MTTLRQLVGRIIILKVHATKDIYFEVVGRVRLVDRSKPDPAFIAIGNNCHLPPTLVVDQDDDKSDEFASYHHRNQKSDDA